MKNFIRKHPIFSECFIFGFGLILAMLISYTGKALYLFEDEHIAIGRIIAGILLALLSFRFFREDRPFSAFLIASPALLFVVWNIVYRVFLGATLRPLYEWPEQFLIGFAPAVFEEVIFRMIFLTILKESGKSDLSAWLIAVLGFGLVHLTNAAGMNVANVLIQVVYATVFGLLFAAVYLKKKDLTTLILFHGLVDTSDHLFETGSQTTPLAFIIIFILLLTAEAYYAYSLMKKK